MNKKLWQRLVYSSGVLMVVIGMSASGVVFAQVPDADCFSGACGGLKGIPQCPKGYDEVGFVLYANSKANATKDCETVVSCTNLGRQTVELNCRFYYGFYPISSNGDVRDALCFAITPDVAPGDTNECATDATAAPDFQSGGIFLAGDSNCPTFEGKGLVCAKGGDPKRIFCEAHLRALSASCRTATTRRVTLSGGEQQMLAVLELADRAIILDMGQIVFNGPAQAVMKNAELHQEYLAI